MDVLLHNKTRMTKLLKTQENFCNADANVSGDADAQLLMLIFPDGPAKLQQLQKSRYRKLNLSIILISLLNSRLISLKQENLARRWRTAWRFQIFLMASHLFLFIRDVLYAHTRQHKKILCCTKSCCVNKKKYFTQKLTLCNKII